MKEGLILFNMMQNNFEFLMFLKRNGISFSNFPLTLMFICVSHHNEAVENTKKKIQMKRMTKRAKLISRC